MMHTSILYFGINPNTYDHLRLDEEVRAIENALIRSRYFTRPSFVSKWAVRDIELQENLIAYKPTIVHISTHGDRLGRLVLVDQMGNAVPVSQEAIARIFGLVGQSIRCVVLNACYTQEQAEAIAAHIPVVIGMSDAIQDSSAIRFSEAFYMGIGNGGSIKAAFELGRNLIEFASMPNEDFRVPQLYTRTEKEAEKAIFTQPTYVYDQLRRILLNCDEFFSDANLQAIFVHPDLAPFRFGIPQTSNVQSRVTQTLAYLQNKHHANGQAALHILVSVLRDRREIGDMQYYQLDEIYELLLKSEIE